MTVPGRGDLSPPHRQSSVGRWLVTVLVLALLVGGGYAAFLGLTGSSSSGKSGAKLPVCHNAVSTSGPAQPHAVHLVVLNGTLQAGLAAQVATALSGRGFHVGSVGNTSQPITGVAAIRFPAGELREAQAVDVQINGATLGQAHVHHIELALGPQFTALQSKAKVRAARRHLVAQEAARSTASPTPSATCSPAS